MPAIIKPRDDYQCANHRCVVIRTRRKWPHGLDLERAGWSFNERGRYWSRVITDTPVLQVEERHHREFHERIERHYHDPG